MPTESSIMFNSDYFVFDVSCMEILVEFLCGRRSQKFGNLSIREILVLTSAYARPPVQTMEEGEGSLKGNPTWVG